MTDEVLLNKSQIIRRCTARILEEYGGSPESLNNITKLDSIALNLLRDCEAAIELAMHFVAQKGLGVPQTSRDAFNLLETAGFLTSRSALRMRAMVGFRNIAIHDYQKMDPAIVRQIIEDHLTDFETLLQEFNRRESA